MPVLDVPMEQWKDFLESFGREHRHDKVCLELPEQAPEDDREPAVPIDRDLRAPGHEVKLTNLAVMETDECSKLHLTAEGKPGEEIKHDIDAIERVRVEQPEGNRGGTLRIDALGTRTLLVRFAKPLVPGMLNGVTESEI